MNESHLIVADKNNSIVSQNTKEQFVVTMKYHKRVRFISQAIGCRAGQAYKTSTVQELRAHYSFLLRISMQHESINKSAENYGTSLKMKTII